MTYKTHDPEFAVVDVTPHRPRFGNTVKAVAKNSASNVVRVGLTALIAILLPVYLTHRLPVQLYGAWVLILQLGAYVSYLNLGVQTALSKYIAEYQTRQDHDGCGQCASVGLLMMIGASLLGVILTCALVVLAPKLFGELPPDLMHDVRIGVFLVGLSLSIGLCTSVFSAIFLGLQKYHIPMAITVASRVLYAAAVCGAVLLHHGLIAMAIAAAAVNLLTSLAEILVWWRFARFVRVSLHSVNLAMLRRMIAYCSILTIWSACMLFIGGLDVTIVGHYAFNQVAFYSIAGSPTNMILMIIGSVMGPLIPATSALNVTSSPQHMGEILLRTTRYFNIILFATSLPVLVGGYLILRLWVGPVYALQSILFLHVLLLANMIRNLCAPYATMVVATSMQRLGTAAAISEGVVNLGSSILLARHMGAIGVALGTLIGSVAGVTMHFAVSMHYTHASFSVSRTRLFLGGLLRPAAIALPSVLLAPFWWDVRPAPTPLTTWVLWFVATAALAWFVSLTPADRSLISGRSKRLIHGASGDEQRRHNLA